MILPFLILLVVIGFALWLFNTFVTTIDAKMKQLINGIAWFIIIILTIYFIFSFVTYYGPGWHLMAPRR